MKKIILLLIACALAIGVGLYYENTGPRMFAKEDSSKPMLIFKDKEQLWQVITFDGEPVTALAVTIKPVFKQYYRKVYLNHRSQFVFSDGEPILIMDEPIFWNRAGDVVTYDLDRVSESMVFYVNEKGMRPNTAMTLYELREGVKSNIRREINMLRMEDIDVDRRETIKELRAGTVGK